MCTKSTTKDIMLQRSDQAFEEIYYSPAFELVGSSCSPLVSCTWWVPGRWRVGSGIIMMLTERSASMRGISMGVRNTNWLWDFRRVISRIISRLTLLLPMSCKLNTETMHDAEDAQVTIFQTQWAPGEQKHCGYEQTTPSFVDTAVALPHTLPNIERRRESSPACQYRGCKPTTSVTIDITMQTEQARSHKVMELCIACVQPVLSQSQSRMFGIKQKERQTVQPLPIIGK